MNPFKSGDNVIFVNGELKGQSTVIRATDGDYCFCPLSVSQWELLSPKGFHTVACFHCSYFKWEEKEIVVNPFKVGDTVRFIDNELNKTEYPCLLGGTFKIERVRDYGISLWNVTVYIHHSRFEKVEEEETTVELINRIKTIAEINTHSGQWKISNDMSNIMHWCDKLLGRVKG